MGKVKDIFGCKKKIKNSRNDIFLVLYGNRIYKRCKYKRIYFKSVFDYINRPPKETRQLFGKTNLKHRWYFTSTQFALPTEKNYNQLFKNINKSNEWIYSIYRVKVE
jgi:hypothetical protein